MKTPLAGSAKISSTGATREWGLRMQRHVNFLSVAGFNTFDLWLAFN
jgi:hypothetical protein